MECFMDQSNPTERDAICSRAPWQQNDHKNDFRLEISNLLFLMDVCGYLPVGSPQVTFCPISSPQWCGGGKGSCGQVLQELMFWVSPSRIHGPQRIDTSSIFTEVLLMDLESVSSVCLLVSLTHFHWRMFGMSGMNEWIVFLLHAEFAATSSSDFPPFFFFGSISAFVYSDTYFLACVNSVSTMDALTDRARRKSRISEEMFPENTTSSSWGCVSFIFHLITLHKSDITDSPQAAGWRNCFYYDSAEINTHLLLWINIHE